MSDQFTEVSVTSWGDRLKSGLSGLVLGPLFIVGSCALIWWNEDDSVRVAKLIDAGRNEAITVSSESVENPVEGRLVHISGKVYGGVLTDATFSVSVSGAILERKAEMYQWKEKESSKTKSNVGGSQTEETTYSYDRDWSDSAVDSSTFRHPEWHENPREWPTESIITLAPSVKLGARTLENPISSKLSTTQSLPVSGSGTVTLSGALVSGGNVFFAANPADPKVGDVRVSFAYLPDGTDVSIVGQETKDGAITEIQWEKAELTRVVVGKKSAAEMFDMLASENTLNTWLIRIGAFLLMFFGWQIFFSIIPVLVAFLPFFETLAGIATGTVSFGLTSVLWSIVFAFAWFSSRPFLAVSVLAVAVALALLFRSRKSVTNPSVSSGSSSSVTASTPASAPEKTYAESPASIQDFTK